MKFVRLKTKAFFLTIVLACCLCGQLFAESYEKHVLSMRIDDAAKVVVIYMDDDFGEQMFTEKAIRKIYKKTTKSVHKELPAQYRSYDVRIMTKGVSLESLVGEPQKATANIDKSPPKRKHGWWGTSVWEGAPWVTNASLPHRITNGLQGKHIAVWASHGRFYDVAKGQWRWQRPNMFCTNEDLFTQTIVVPYLIPMLERAGANVFTPRERDWQTNEVVVDNDGRTPYYIETTGSGKWKTSVVGFAMPAGNMTDGYNPFEQGTVRQITTTKDDDASTASYQPLFPKRGRYAVYVSYATLSNSVNDALYTVYHQGQKTEFRVNQQMGGGTWVYLGTFEFEQGSSSYNRVEISAHSAKKGVVTTDAVRFGGGMGNIERGGMVSGLPRCLEGARYYAQWAGVPYSVYSLYDGKDDYKDDINTRSLMTNWLAGGSPYAPSKEGKCVPIDLSLAVHSDAGFNNDMESIYGSLAICTTDFNDGRLDAGVSRNHSKDLCRKLLEQSCKDLRARYGKWEWRDLYDRNYSETRLPAMPSAIFETLSHQSFPDMLLGHDPDFKFTLARSIYKTILRYEAEGHGEKKVVVAPLSPEKFNVTLDGYGNAILNWSPQKDNTEASSVPTSYNVYMAMGGFDYDNGRNVEKNSLVQHLEPDLLYRFRVTAVNTGGESFPTEELCVVWHGQGAPTVMIVNGFQRLSGPTVVNTPTDKGFDLNDDPGVAYGMTAGWSGYQQVFSTATAGQEGYGTFGYCGNELAGQFVAGNSFNYVAEHALAIMSANSYNVVSSTKSVVEWGDVSLADYDVVDLILGNEKYVDNTYHVYKTFTKQMQKQLLAYQRNGRGALLVSGSYIGSDMRQESERIFLRQLLNMDYVCTVRTDNAVVTGLQQTLAVTNTLNPDHYATVQSDVLKPYGEAFVAMQYRNGLTAAVACRSSVKTFAMGFPFECITNSAQRAVVMQGILAFLVN